MDHMVERYGDRIRQSQDDIADRIADEDNVNSSLIGQPSGRAVIGGNHDDLLAPRFFLGEVGDPNFARLHILPAFRRHHRLEACATLLRAPARTAGVQR